MKVKATNEFKKKGVPPAELDFIPEEGFEFEVSESRFNVLAGNNSFKVKFVEAVVETAKKEPVVEKAVKKTTKTTKKTTKKSE